MQQQRCCCWLPNHCSTFSHNRLALILIGAATETGLRPDAVAVIAAVVVSAVAFAGSVEQGSPWIRTGLAVKLPQLAACPMTVQPVVHDDVHFVEVPWRC